MTPVQAILTTSADGWLSLLHHFDLDTKIKVWTLLQSISIRSECLIDDGRIPQRIYFSAFCPQSRCVVAMSSKSNKEFLIDLSNRSSCPLVTRIGNYDELDCWPYEIDCSSTYISRMKHF
jgi:hypothetical protein